MIAKFILTSLLVLMIASCAHRQDTFKPVPPEADQALLYVYRTHNFSNVLIVPRLRIGEQHELNMADGQCVWFSLPPGRYRLQLQLAERYQGQHDLDVDLAAGERRFVALTTQLKFRKNQLYDRRFDLQPIEAQQALQQISACSAHGEVAAEPQRPADSETSRPRQSEFSIQKSRDPFSRQ